MKKQPAPSRPYKPGLGQMFRMMAQKVIIKHYCPVCGLSHDFVLTEVKRGGRTEKYNCTTDGCSYSIYFNVK